MNEHIAYAREWLGTPYHAQAALPGVGVDCSNLVLDALSRSGMVIKWQQNAYRLGRTSHDGEIMMGTFLSSIHPDYRIQQVDDILAGDVLFFQFVGKLRHTSIATSPTTHIHTSAIDLKGVCENVITNGFLQRLHSIVRFERVTP